MAVFSEGAPGTRSAAFCPKCGHPCAGERYCTECGSPLDPAPPVTEATAELPRLDRPPLGAPPQTPLPDGRRPRSRLMVIIGAAALLIAAIAALAIILLNGSGSSSGTTSASAYRAKLTSALAPVVSANQTLSAALQALDGSKKTIGAAQNDTSQAQSAVTAARGAVGILTVPSSQALQSQQVQQALTEENGYLQALSSTLSDPAGQSSSQLRPLLTATQSAMVPLGSVAQGATTSLSGVDNVLSWVAGATAVTQAAQRKSQSQSSSTSTSTQQSAAPPSGSPSGLTSCDQNISINSATSCAFADNVFYQYAQDVQQAGAPGSYIVYAYSPATSQSYNDTCSYNPTNQIVLCSHGSDLVQFPYWAAEVYQPGG